MHFFHSKVQNKPNNILLMNHKSDCNSFHRAMEFPIKLAQVFGYFPVAGLGGPTYKSLKFKWLSWRMGYCSFTLLLFLTDLVILLYNICCGKSVSLLRITVLWFFIENITNLILFCKFAKEWKIFVQQWHILEMTMRHYEISENLTKQIKRTTSIILLVAFLDHAMVNSYKLKDSFDTETTIYNAFKDFFLVSYKDVFIVTEYAVWKGVLLQWMNAQRTFLWSYIDIFIIIIGSSVTFRIRQIAKKVKLLSKVVVGDIYVWRSVREDYVRLTKLVEIVNDKMAYLILVSFSSNIFFLVIQLFSSIKPMKNMVAYAYFLLSFFYLISRVTCVCFFGGAIQEETSQMVKALNSVHSSSFNNEVHRFIIHLSTYEMVLTGKQFFKISRNLLLQIAGAIVTYELALIQFSGRSEEIKVAA